MLVECSACIATFPHSACSWAKIPGLEFVRSSFVCPGIRDEPIYTNAGIVTRSIKLRHVSIRARMYVWGMHTGVRKDSATKRALAFNW